MGGISPHRGVNGADRQGTGGTREQPVLLADTRSTRASSRMYPGMTMCRRRLAQVRSLSRQLWVAPVALVLLTLWLVLLPWESADTLVTAVADDVLHPRYLHRHGNPADVVHSAIAVRKDGQVDFRFLLPLIWARDYDAIAVAMDGQELWSEEWVAIDYFWMDEHGGFGLPWWTRTGEVILVRPVRGVWSREELKSFRARLLDAYDAWDPGYLDPVTSPQLRGRDVLETSVHPLGIAADLLALLTFAALLVSLHAWGSAVWRKLFTPVPEWQCRQCGYDLRGIDGSVCPECGRQRSPTHTDDLAR